MATGGPKNGTSTSDVPPIKSRGGRLWPENCTYGYFGLFGHEMGKKKSGMFLGHDPTRPQRPVKSIGFAPTTT